VPCHIFGYRLVARGYHAFLRDGWEVWIKSYCTRRILGWGDIYLSYSICPYILREVQDV
jgi:hypothetical protein